MNCVRATTKVYLLGDVFTATIFPGTDEHRDFVSIDASIGGATMSLFINDLASAVSLVKAASEAVEYFSELEAQKEGVQDADE